MVKRRPDGFAGAASGGRTKGWWVGVRVGTRRRGQTDIRGLVTAGRAVRLERFCWS